MNSDPKAEARYVVRYRRPIAMPFATRNLHVGIVEREGKVALLREPFVPRAPRWREESIAEFVVRRLNREFLDQMIDALVAGIYAGDPHKLSVQHAFPRLAELEARYGSLIKGQIFGARERKKRGEISKDRAPKFSFDEGLQVLPDALAAQLGDSLKLNTAVTKLTQTGDGWRVATSSTAGEMPEHGAVIYCGTAHKLAELEIEVGRQASARVGAARNRRARCRATRRFPKSVIRRWRAWFWDSAARTWRIRARVTGC